jgi:hypothetical protein
MRRLAGRLTTSGYIVHNIGYRSTRLTIEQVAEQYLSKTLGSISSTDTIHVVTHSLGGIVLRLYLSQNRLTNLGRVVMLAPPNQGSEVVDRLRHWRLFRWFNGPAGLQLGTDPLSLPRQLPAANFELGIIAGNKSINFWLSTLLPSPNDGKVSVQSTRVEGMREHIILPVTHPFIMRDKQVISHTLRFLQHGTFDLNRKP